MTTLEFILIPFIVILIAIIFIILEKKKQLVKVVHQQTEHTQDQNTTIAKQLAVITMLKDNRCGNHIFDLGEKVLLQTQVNGLSHEITEVFVKKNREVVYTCRRGDSATRMPEHLLKRFEDQKD